MCRFMPWSPSTYKCHFAVNLKLGYSRTGKVHEEKERKPKTIVQEKEGKEREIFKAYIRILAITTDYHICTLQQFESRGRDGEPLQHLLHHVVGVVYQFLHFLLNCQLANSIECSKNKVCTINCTPPLLDWRKVNKYATRNARSTQYAVRNTQHNTQHIQPCSSPLLSLFSTWKTCRDNNKQSLCNF